MIPINIYNLTRIKKISLLTKIERQMSKRRGLLKIKSWEIDSLKKLSEHLKEEMDNGTGVLFYYSFQIPKLGKEFDLLRISDEYVLNILECYYIKPDEVILILVDQNRLAKMTEGGNILGFRGVFVLAHSLPTGTVARIAERKPTPTSVINLNGEQVDVEKFLREGRVYIRMGEDLYTINGEKVE